MKVSVVSRHLVQLVTTRVHSPDPTFPMNGHRDSTYDKGTTTINTVRLTNVHKRVKWVIKDCIENPSKKTVPVWHREDERWLSNYVNTTPVSRRESWPYVPLRALISSILGVGSFLHGDVTRLDNTGERNHKVLLDYCTSVWEVFIRLFPRIAPKDWSRVSDLYHI